MTQRSITIVGAGQSGLQLGLGLLQNGYAVRMISDRTPEEIRAGRVASSQCMFATSLSYERAVGVDMWDDAPPVDGMGFTAPHPELPGEKAFSWAGKLNSPAQSIDQRVKFPTLIELFVSRGGEMVYAGPGLTTSSATRWRATSSSWRQARERSHASSNGMRNARPSTHRSAPSR